MSVAIELEVARTWISVCPVAEGRKSLSSIAELVI